MSDEWQQVEYHKKTGQRARTLSEYEDVFESLMQYEKHSLKKSDIDKVKSKDDMKDWLSNVIVNKSADWGILAEKIAKTDRYQEIVQRNQAKEERVPVPIIRRRQSSLRKLSSRKLYNEYRRVSSYERKLKAEIKRREQVRGHEGRAAGRAGHRDDGRGSHKKAPSKAPRARAQAGRKGTGKDRGGARKKKARR